MRNPKYVLFSLAAICAVSTAQAATDAAMLSLARARNCMACHQMVGKVVGPGFDEVANRYAGQPGAADVLARKIRAGGSGAWGTVPMPANLQASPEEAQLLAKWILTR